MPRLPSVPAILLALLMPVASATAAVIHVPADYPTIQEAIDAAVDGDEVRIAPGTYPDTWVSLNKAITLGSTDGPEVTVLQGNDLHWILAIGPAGPDTIIEGLSFAESNIQIGTGLLMISGSPVIRDCIFADNTGVRAVISGADGTIEDCTFTGNELQLISGGTGTIARCTFSGNVVTTPYQLVSLGGGAMVDCVFEGNDGASSVTVSDSADVLIGRCTFTANTTSGAGGAVSVVDHPVGEGVVTISECDFIDNGAGTTGGAISADAFPLTITQCTFDGNTAPSGGAVDVGAGVTVATCTFRDNVATDDGGALVLNDAAAVDCTFTGNQAGGDGGAVHVTGTTSSLTNCHATDNVAGGGGGGLSVPEGLTGYATDSVFCMNTPDQIHVGGLLVASNVIACDQPLDDLGACCLPADGCVMTTDASCAAVGGTYVGDGTSCGDASCAAPCAADVNGDGIVDVGDLITVLAGWGVCP